MPPAALVCRKINPCRYATTLRIYHCRTCRADPKMQHLWHPLLCLEKPERRAGKCRARAESVLGVGSACPSLGLDRSCRVVTAETTRAAGAAGDQETWDLSSAFFLFFIFNAKSCPRIEIVSSRCCSRTQSFLFPAQYLNFSGGWRLIDVAISFYSTSVKSKLPSQCCCCGDSSRKAVEQPS